MRKAIAHTNHRIYEDLKIRAQTRVVFIFNKRIFKMLLQQAAFPVWHRPLSVAVNLGAVYLANLQIVQQE